MGRAIFAFVLLAVVAPAVWHIRQDAAAPPPAAACAAQPAEQALVAREQRKALLLLQQGQPRQAAPPSLTQSLEVLAKANPSDVEGPWTVSVIPGDTPNAFSGADGALLVSRGLLAAGLTHEELTAVLAHEMAHVLLSHALHRHCAEREKGSAEHLLHQFEMAADERAVSLLHEAGYPPEAMATGVDKLYALSANTASSASSASPSGHPAHAPRAAALAKALERLRSNKPA